MAENASNARIKLAEIIGKSLQTAEETVAKLHRTKDRVQITTIISSGAATLVAAAVSQRVDGTAAEYRAAGIRKGAPAQRIAGCQRQKAGSRAAARLGTQYADPQAERARPRRVTPRFVSR